MEKTNRAATYWRYSEIKVYGITTVTDSSLPKYYDYEMGKEFASKSKTLFVATHQFTDQRLSCIEIKCLNIFKKYMRIFKLYFNTQCPTLMVTFFHKKN